VEFEHGLTEDVKRVRARGGIPVRGGLPPPIGLRTFVVERSESVRQQLAGERPSAGDGNGNGGTMGMLGRRNGRPDRRPLRN